MERDVKIDGVRTFETRSGNTRYVVRDSDGNEYTTFREANEKLKPFKTASPRTSSTTSHGSC